MKAFAYCLLALILTGCASNSGVVSIGKDTYIVSRQAATGSSGLGSLKAKAFKEANQYCSCQKKVMRVVHTEESKPPFIFGNYPRVEVRFV